MTQLNISFNKYVIFGQPRKILTIILQLATFICLEDIYSDVFWIDNFYELYHLIKIRLIDIEVKYKVYANLHGTIRTDTIDKLMLSFSIISIHFVQNLVIKSLYAKRVLTDFRFYK